MQPRDAAGRFISDENALRKFITSQFKGISHEVGENIGTALKWGGRALVVADFALEAKEYYDENDHNVGRAISYGAYAVGVGVIAGAIAGSLSTPLLVAAGVVVVGDMVAKTVYNNFKPVKDVVDSVGDGINNVGKAICSVFSPA